MAAIFTTYQSLDEQDPKKLQKEGFLSLFEKPHGKGVPCTGNLSNIIEICQLFKIQVTLTTC